MFSGVGGAQWLARRAPDRGARVRALTGSLGSLSTDVFETRTAARSCMFFSLVLLTEFSCVVFGLKC